MEVVKLGLILTIGIIGVFIVWGFVIEELNKLSRQVIYRAFGIPALYITSFIAISFLLYLLSFHSLELQLNQVEVYLLKNL